LNGGSKDQRYLFSANTVPFLLSLLGVNWKAMRGRARFPTPSGTERWFIVKRALPDHTQSPDNEAEQAKLLWAGTVIFSFNGGSPCLPFSLWFEQCMPIG